MVVVYLDQAEKSSQIVYPLSPSERPDILYRVIGRGGRWPNIGFDEDGNLIPDSDSTGPFIYTDFEDHLAWCCLPTPFISLYNDWDTVKLRVTRFMEWNADEVYVVAVWSRDLDCLYDAKAIMTTLSREQRGKVIDKNISWYNHEYLCAGPILECRCLVVHSMKSCNDYDDFMDTQPRAKEWTAEFFRSVDHQSALRSSGH
ncbi:hypothetical protein F4810DRAFT_715130 [Camillea tinctor]|nr:hypothetical protein F4810DRAFT_715130 [Camillea tinctor]